MATYSGNCIDSGAVGVIEGLFERIQNWFKVQQLKVQVSRERQQLLEISEAGLSDMGITRSQAVQEARRIDLPSGRLQMHGIEVC